MKNTPQSEATAKSLRAFPAEVSSFLTAGEEGGGGFGKCAIPLGGSVCHHGRSGVKGLGRTGGSKPAGQKEASDVDKKDAGSICAKLLSLGMSHTQCKHQSGGD